MFRRESLEAASRAGEHSRQLVVGRGQGKESTRGPRAIGVSVDAVESQGVEVEVEIERRPEALEEGDGAALRVAGSPMTSRAPAQLGEEGPHEGAEHLARESRVVGTAVAERVGKREHPLADRNLGQNAVDEVCGGVGHAAAAAGGTKAAPLARKGDEAIVAAVVAVQAQEAVGEDAAA
jgi:hypothetical protein